MIDHFRTAYQHEFEQRGALTASASVPTLALTIVGGALVALLGDYRFMPSVGSVWIGLLSFCSLIALMIGLVNLRNVVRGYDYQRPRDPAALHAHLRLLRRHFASRKGLPDGGARQAEEKFEEQLTERFAEAASSNAAINRKRGEALDLATHWSLIALVLAGLASPPWVVQRSQERDAPMRVEVVRMIAEEDAGMSEANKPEDAVEGRKVRQSGPLARPSEETGSSGASAEAQLIDELWRTAPEMPENETIRTFFRIRASAEAERSEDR